MDNLESFALYGIPLGENIVRQEDVERFKGIKSIILGLFSCGDEDGGHDSEEKKQAEQPKEVQKNIRRFFGKYRNSFEGFSKLHVYSFVGSGENNKVSSDHFREISSDHVDLTAFMNLYWKKYELKDSLTGDEKMIWDYFMRIIRENNMIYLENINSSETDSDESIPQTKAIIMSGVEKANMDQFFETRENEFLNYFSKLDKWDVILFKYYYYMGIVGSGLTKEGREVLEELIVKSGLTWEGKEILIKLMDKSGLTEKTKQFFKERENEFLNYFSKLDKWDVILFKYYCYMSKVDSILLTKKEKEVMKELMDKCGLTKEKLDELMGNKPIS